MTRIWRFLTSVKVAITLGAAILLSALVATLLKPEAAGPKVYHAKWFLVLLGAFAVNLVCCAIQRLRYLKFATLGSFLSHLGALTILGGAAAGGIWGVEGYVELKPGQETDRFFSEDGKKTYSLPFRLSLERFSLDLYPPRLWVFDSERPDGKKTTDHPAKKGSVVSAGEVRFTVVETYENYRLDSEVAEVPDGRPAIRVELRDPQDKVAFDDWIFDRGAGIVYLGDPSALEKRPEEEGSLFVRLRDVGITRVFPLDAANPFHVSDQFTLRIEKATLDYSKADQPNDRLTPVNPALLVRISGPSGDENRWIFAKFPQYAEQHSVTYKNLSLIYDFPDDDQPERARICTIQGRQELYLPATRERSPLEPDRATSLGPEGFKLTLREFAPSRAIVRKESDAGGGLLRPAVKLRIQAPDEDREVVLELRQSVFAKESRVAVAYGYDEGLVGDIRNFESRVRAGNVTATISVNHPLSRQGYRIYQNAYKPREGGAWRPAFRIVKDPGLPWIYAGFVLLGVGLLYAAVVRPILRRKS